MLLAEQGDVIKVSGIRDLLLVVSNNEFNQKGSVITCPVQDGDVPSPIHPSVLVRMNQKVMQGFVRCEDPRRLDLRARRFTKAGAVDYFQLMDVSDILVAIFEYN